MAYNKSADVSRLVVAVKESCTEADIFQWVVRGADPGVQQLIFISHWWTVFSVQGSVSGASQHCHHHPSWWWPRHSGGTWSREEEQCSSTTTTLPLLSMVSTDSCHLRPVEETEWDLTESCPPAPSPPPGLMEQWSWGSVTSTRSARRNQSRWEQL